MHLKGACFLSRQWGDPHIPDLTILNIPTGTKCYDWEVPEEWEIRDAFIKDTKGNKIVDFKDHNLHVVGYSCPVEKSVTLDELQEHLYSIPQLPDAIPYVTSYYEKNWGFCIEHQKREKLTDGNYFVKIDSSFKKGNLTLGELIINGESEKEIFLSTYICHPSMANNEVSEPAVTAHLAKWLMDLNHRKYSYRIIFIPEIIGSACYLSRNLKKMKKRIIAGFVVTCVGDNNTYSFLPSRDGNTIADKISRHVLKNSTKGFTEYSWLDRGSDERHYCWPGVDLPVVSIMRSKYHEYPEYHTSKDDLNFISEEGLLGSYEVLKKAIVCLENEFTPKVKIMCEPHLSKRGLYAPIGTRGKYTKSGLILDFLSCSDGKHSLLDISNKINVPMWELAEVADLLIKHNLIESLDNHKKQIMF